MQVKVYIQAQSIKNSQLTSKSVSQKYNKEGENRCDKRTCPYSTLCLSAYAYSALHAHKEDISVNVAKELMSWKATAAATQLLADRQCHKRFCKMLKLLLHLRLGVGCVTPGRFVRQGLTAVLQSLPATLPRQTCHIA